MTKPKSMRNELAGPRVAEAFKKNGFDASYVSTKAEALQKALTYINAETDLVAWGGCASAEECGLLDEMRSGRYRVIDRDTATSPEERMEMCRQGLLADVFIGGANALTEKGELVNIDGNGNRVAAMTFGPRTVIVIAGMNKVMPDMDSAMKRARCIAAPINVQRFGLSTPCSKAGQCADCQSPERICNYFQVIARSKPAGKIKLILVGEDLGF